MDPLGSRVRLLGAATQRPGSGVQMKHRGPARDPAVTQAGAVGWRGQRALDPGASLGEARALMETDRAACQQPEGGPRSYTWGFWTKSSIH